MEGIESNMQEVTGDRRKLQNVDHHGLYSLQMLVGLSNQGG
jgi:hypothetical protein